MLRKVGVGAEPMRLRSEVKATQHSGEHSDDRGGDAALGSESRQARKEFGG